MKREGVWGEGGGGGICSIESMAVPQTGRRRSSREVVNHLFWRRRSAVAAETRTRAARWKESHASLSLCALAACIVESAAHQIISKIG